MFYHYLKIIGRGIKAMSILSFKKSVFALSLVVFAMPNAGFAQSNEATNKEIPTTLPPISSPQEYVRQKPGELLFETPRAENHLATNNELNSPLLTPNLPQKPLTKAQIAKQIAPYYDVTKNYNRLVQCYGTADFLGAFTNVRASSPGANPQLKKMAASIDAQKGQMQPFVLASMQTIAADKFRADYDKIARNVQNQVFGAKDFNVALNKQLATLNSCGKDIQKWHNGK